VYGNSFESSLVAVVNPNQQALERWAEQNGITGSFAEVCENSRAKEHVLVELAKIAKENKANCSNKDLYFHVLYLHFPNSIINDCHVFLSWQLKGFELIKAIHLHPVPFDMERDLITPTYKKKRPQMLKHYLQVRCH
jgi:long-chain acyl-CoA synthetase